MIYVVFAPHSFHTAHTHTDTLHNTEGFFKGNKAKVCVCVCVCMWCVCVCGVCVVCCGPPTAPDD